MAKSTPLADRRSAVVEALCMAAQDYEPGFGDMETYLEGRVKCALRAENQQYAKSFGLRSLDQLLSAGSDGDFCLYDTIAGIKSDWLDTWDNRLDAERFCGTLPPLSRI